MYIRIQWHKSNEDAKDLTQEFFARFLEKEYLDRFDPSKGRFRVYIKTILKHFLLDAKKTDGAKKRGSDRLKVNFDSAGEDEATVDPGADPAVAFDREWALSVMSNAVKEMREALLSGGKAKYFEIFEAAQINRTPASQTTLKELALSKGITETEMHNYLRYTKRLLERHIRKEVGKYVYDSSETDDEIKFLLSIRF